MGRGISIESVREIIIRILTIAVAYSAKDALACVGTFSPGVALLDIGLPEMNGFELARKLRALAGVGAGGPLESGVDRVRAEE